MTSNLQNDFDRRGAFSNEPNDPLPGLSGRYSRKRVNTSLGPDLSEEQNNEDLMNIVAIGQLPIVEMLLKNYKFSPKVLLAARDKAGEIGRNDIVQAFNDSLLSNCAVVVIAASSKKA